MVFSSLGARILVRPSTPPLQAHRAGNKDLTRLDEGRKRSFNTRVMPPRCPSRFPCRFPVEQQASGRNVGWSPH